MKYSVVVLACVLAVAAAVEYKSGQYIPERKSISQIKPYRYQQSRPYVSSTPFPGLYVSSTPVPVTFAPARSTIYYASSTPKPVFNIPAIPARSLSIEPVKPVESAKASWSAPVEVTTITPIASVSDSASWSARASWPTVSSESAKIDLPVAPTQAALVASVSPSVAPTLASWSGPTEISAIASASPSVVSELPSWTARASWPAVSSESSQSELLIAPTQSSLFASPSVAPIVSEIKTPVVSVVPAARLAPAVRVTPVAPVFSVTPVAPIYQQAKIALPAARYAGEARAAETLRYSNQINSDGAFQYSYETNNGIVAEEQGAPRSFRSGNDEVAPVVAQGSFGWTSPEGQQITISYVADETGYHPSGSAIPEMPPQIARALEYIAARNLHA